MAAALFARSPAAWDTVLLAWMSERVNEQILRRFVFHVITSVADAPHGNAAGYGDAVTGDEEEQVRAAAYKVSRELHRIRGFLRFSPDRCGIYTARCAPDHFVLPALAVHFTARFGAAPWAIRDEKRRLVLTPFPVAGERGAEGGPADFCLMDAAEYDAPAPGREYAAEADRIAEDCATQHRGTENDAEDLWRIYHGSVSNADRQNPALQKRFMPARYRPYLPECFPAGTTFPDRPDADGAGE